MAARVEFRQAVHRLGQQGRSRVGLVPGFIDGRVPEPEIGAQVHHPAVGGQQGRHHFHGGLVGDAGKHEIGPGPDGLGVRDFKGQVADAGQGRKDPVKGLSRPLPGGQGRELAARMPHQ